MDFKGKNAIITGASKGIGHSTAVKMSEYGSNLVLIDIDEENLHRTEDELKKFNNEVITYVCDVSDEKKVNYVVDDAIKHCGRIDILVNNAGIFRSYWSLFSESGSDSWRKNIDINILGTLYFTRAVINNMLENQYGRIINIASVAGVYGISNMVPYSMTKGAIISFTKALAKEVTGQGVLVNAVSPGNISSDGISNNLELSFMNRSGTPEECAELICFLASDSASYISGQNYIIDGCRKKM